MSRLTFVLLVTGGVHLAAGTNQNCAAESWAKEAVVVIQSTRSFDEAKSTAMSAADRLNIKLHLRDLSPSTKTGLTLPESACHQSGASYPCYVTRGRHEDGVYVSVEHSSAYRGFAKGLYIVVVASGAPDDPDIRDALARARKAYPEAYSKVTKVYMGCIQ